MSLPLDRRQGSREPLSKRLKLSREARFTTVSSAHYWEQQTGPEMDQLLFLESDLQAWVHKQFFSELVKTVMKAL